MESITLSIDGKTITCSAETSILNAAQELGIKIPNLCHHPDLKPFGACRLCLVEDEETGRIMASCVTPVAPKISILTDTPNVKTHRRNIIRLMMAEHPESCVVCSKGNRCRLRQFAAQLGIGETNLYPMPNYKTLEQANPFITRDLSKCILCGKCIRADHELVVVGAIDYNLRGFKSRPTTVHDRGLEQSNCTFCGTCLSMCPTGALSQNNKSYISTPGFEALSICGFCGVGCNLAMGYTANRIVEVNPSNRQDTVNGATLCVRGHFSHDFLNSSDRLSQPLIRQDTADAENTMVPASWDEAMEIAAARLLKIKKENGPQSVAFLGSSKCTNEENYLFQKIARVLFNTNNVDNGGYLSGRPVMNLLDKRTDGLWRLGPLAWLEKAQAVFVLGADPGHSMPVVSYYLKRACKKGIPLVVADSRRTDLADFSSAWLDLSTGNGLEPDYVALINGLAALLYEKKGHDDAYIKQFTEGFEQYSSGLASLKPKQVSRATGIDAKHYVSLGQVRDEIRRLVPMYADLDRHTGTAWITVDGRREGDKVAKTKTIISFSPVVSCEGDIKDELSDKDYAFTAIFGFVRYHFGGGTRTGYSNRSLKLDFKGEIELSPQDGEKLKINDQDTVKVSSRHGEIKRQIRLSRRLSPGQIFIPLAFNDNDAMNLIAMTPLGMPDSPGWKTCRVKVEKK